MRSPWDTLGLHRGATAEQVRARYRQLVKEWHPDRFATDLERRPEAEARLKAINLAYHAIRTGRPAECSHRQSEPASPTQSVRDGSPVKALQSQVVLTYLPVIVLVLFLMEHPAVGTGSVLLAIAWSLMAWNVWHNEWLTAGSRLVWISVLIAFAPISVPLYFEVHVREPGA